MTLVRTKRNANEMPSIFDDFFDFSPNSVFRRGHNVPVNVKETDDSYHLELAAPGMKKEDFKIELDENVLTVSSERKEEHNEEKENYTRREFSYASFSRSFSLPGSVNGDKIKANYKDGVLSVDIPKSNQKKSRFIDIL